jgi:hypothetical protein
VGRLGLMFVRNGVSNALVAGVPAFSTSFGVEMKRIAGVPCATVLVVSSPIRFVVNTEGSR